jgi:hypothetical protein
MRDMIKRVVVALAVVLAVSLATGVEAAKITTLKATEAQILIALEGRIDNLTPVKLRVALLSASLKHYSAKITVILHSPGGEVRSGLAIAGMLRSYKANTYVPPGAKCYSSCTMAFLGGVKRTAVGTLGYHNAYYEREPKACKEGEVVEEFINGQAFGLKLISQLTQYVDAHNIRNFIKFYSDIVNQSAKTNNEIIILPNKFCEQVGICKS